LTTPQDPYGRPHDAGGQPPGPPPAQPPPPPGWPGPASTPGESPGFGQAETVGAGYGEPGGSPAEPPRRSRGRWIAIGIGAVAVAALAAGAAFAVSALRGGGAQPEEFVPGNAIGFVKVDLDPSAGQKVGAIRFLRKFPEVREKFSEDRDLRQSVFELLAENGAIKDVDYATEVEPWLGDRAGIGVLPPEQGSEPLPVVAIQVKDEGKARDGIAKLAQEGGGEPPGVVVRDGYAIVAETQAQADAASTAAAESSLSDNEGFAADFERLGDMGINAGWVDLDAVREMAGELGAGGSEAAALEGLSGRLSYAVRFDGDDLEFVGDAVGLKGVPKTDGETTARMGDLPPSTVAAFALANGDAYVREGWQRFRDTMEKAGGDSDIQSTIDQFEKQYGLTLPDDLAVAFGKSLTVAVDGKNLSEEPQIGARVVTDGDRAMKLVETIERAIRDEGSLVALSRARTDDGIVVASTDGYADALAKKGNLGESDGFKSAVPDIEGANVAIYVDVDQIAEQFSEEVGSPTAQESLAAIDAVGMTAVIEGEGSVRYRIKVATK
jgi:hypothetical protein